MLSDVALNQQQFVVLKEIQERGPLMQRQICSALLFEKSNVSKIVKKLQSRGLVAAAPSPTDARAVRVRVTARGRRVIGRSMLRLRTWNKAWLAGLSARELREAQTMLDRIATLAR